MEYTGAFTFTINIPDIHDTLKTAHFEWPMYYQDDNAMLLLMRKIEKYMNKYKFDVPYMVVKTPTSEMEIGGCLEGKELLKYLES